MNISHIEEEKVKSTYLYLLSISRQSHIKEMLASIIYSEYRTKRGRFFCWHKWLLFFNDYPVGYELICAKCGAISKRYPFFRKLSGNPMLSYDSFACHYENIK